MEFRLSRVRQWRNTKWLHSNCWSVVSVLVLLSLTGCSSIPSVGSPLETVVVGPGPEDIDFDVDQAGLQTILVSCSERRKGFTPAGYSPCSEIGKLDIESRNYHPLCRVNEPDDLHFDPHGIDLVRLDGELFLYVISHNDDCNQHLILRYRVQADCLVFDCQYRCDELLVSPNAIAVFPDGGFLVTNDARIRNSVFRKNCSVIYCDPAGNFQIAANGIGMANGIHIEGDKVFVAASLDNCVYSFDFCCQQLINRCVVAKVKGPDNIRPFKGGLLLACHVSPMAFLAHSFDYCRPAPSVVYWIDLDSCQMKTVYGEKGCTISAASTGIIVDGELILAQVFNPHLLVAIPQLD